MQRRLIAGSAALAASTLIGAATVLTLAPTANGYPIGPECQGHFQIPDGLDVVQDNHLTVHFSVKDGQSLGPVYYMSTDPRDPVPVYGQLSGGMNPDGRTFTLHARWDNGFSNDYYGTISNDGTIFGYTVNNRNTRNNWTTSRAAACVVDRSPTPTGPPPQIN